MTGFRSLWDISTIGAESVTFSGQNLVFGLVHNDQAGFPVVSAAMEASIEKLVIVDQSGAEIGFMKVKMPTTIIAMQNNIVTIIVVAVLQKDRVPGVDL